MKLTTKLLALICLIFSFTTSITATELEEIIVYAQKTEQSLQDVGQSVSAIGGDLLEANRIFSINDLTNFVPNVTVGQSFGFSQITIRGVGFESAFPIPDASTAVHIDGAVENSPGGQFGIGLYDIKGIEIIRGPSGTTYGRNATGGAINIITNKPTEDLSGYARISAGNLLDYLFEGAIGGSIIDNKVLGRLAVKLDDTDYTSGINILDGTDIGVNKSQSFRGHLQFNLSENAELLLSAEYSKSEGTSGQQIYRGPNFPGDPNFLPLGILFGGTTAPGTRDINSDANIINEGDSLSLTANLDWDLNENYTFRSISNFRESDGSAQLDIDFTDAVFSNLGAPGESTSFSQEFQLLIENERLRALLGVFYFNDERSSQTRITGNPNPLLTPDGALTVFFTGSIDTESAAIFGNLSFDLTDTLAANIGGRYSYEDRSGVTPVFRTPVVLVTDFAASKSFNDFSPQAGLEWRPFSNNDQMLYLRYAEGFKSGVLIPAQISPVLDPEQITSYEVGFKGQFADNSVRLNAAAFYYDYRDQQIARSEIVPGGGFISILENAAESKVKGLELEFSWLTTEALRFDGYVAYLDASFSDFVTKDPLLANLPIGDVPIQVSGNTLAQSPEWSGKLRSEIRFSVFDYGLANLGLEAVYKDKVYFSAVNNDRLSQEAVTTINADLRITPDDGKWYVLLSGRNLTDEDIYIQSFPFSTSRAIGAILAPPRSYGIMLGYDF